jgi:hypothetical protein
LFDPHSHTLQSGGVLTPEQNLQYHIALGYNSCVITDKLSNDLKSWTSTIETQRIAREKYTNTIKILIGIEWGSNRGHFNIILPPFVTNLDINNYKNSSESYRNKIPYYGMEPTDEQIQLFINKTHELGGIVIIDHLLYSLPIMPSHPSHQQLYLWGVDYIEIVNGKDFDQVSYEFCCSTGMGMIATSGMHVPDKDPVQGWTALNVQNWSEQSIFDELKYNRTAIIFQPFAAPYPGIHKPNPIFTLLKPMIQVGMLLYEYYPEIMNNSWIGVIILIGNLIGWFFIIELIRFSIIKIFQKNQSKNKDQNQKKKN